MDLRRFFDSRSAWVSRVNDTRPGWISLGACSSVDEQRPSAVGQWFESTQACQMEDVAQSVERRFVVPNVAGSPVILPIFVSLCGFRALVLSWIERRTSNRRSQVRILPGAQPGPLAQLAEQRTLNPQVEGSIPSWPTKKPDDTWDTELGALVLEGPQSLNGWQKADQDIELRAQALVISLS